MEMCESRNFGHGGVDGINAMVELDDDRHIAGGSSGAREVSIVETRGGLRVDYARVAGLMQMELE
jgi:hypothetical protein